MDGYTARIAASGMNMIFEPVGGRQRDALVDPHVDFPAYGWLEPGRSDGAVPQTSLGVMLRASEVEKVAARIAPLARHFTKIVFVVDGPQAAAVPASIDVHAHRFEGDYSVQRNILQGLSLSTWMLQIDSDEMPDADLLAALPWVTEQADRQGIVSIGFRRRNVVGGCLSDHWPDVQYRLNRSHVHYAGKVHERPVRPWQASTLILSGAIDHCLQPARVKMRTREYGMMAPGADRLADEQALLRPFDPR
ncbi:MAG: hypothetical protein WA979_13260 [Pacificimonas sp.]